MYSSSTTSRKALRVGALAGLLLTTLALTATPAQAVVSVNDGVGHVDKGDVQSALKWNNGDFDRGVASLKFTMGAAKAERVDVDYPMVCMNLTTGDMSTVGHRLIVQPGKVSNDVTATQVLSSNGRQVTGWDLTSAPGAFIKVGSTVSRDTGCEGGALVMNSGAATLPMTVTVTGAAGGLKVNGVDLPNTPVG